MIKRLHIQLHIMAVLLLAGCTGSQVISYQHDIYPVLQQKCQKCHLPPDGPGYIQTGLNMKSYETLMKGTVFGEVIIPGDSRRSVLNKLVEGRAGDMMRMPHGEEERLSERDVELFRLWVDQGAKNN